MRWRPPKNLLFWLLLASLVATLAEPLYYVANCSWSAPQKLIHVL